MTFTAKQAGQPGLFRAIAAPNLTTDISPRAYRRTRSLSDEFDRTRFSLGVLLRQPVEAPNFVPSETTYGSTIIVDMTGGGASIGFGLRYIDPGGNDDHGAWQAEVGSSDAQSNLPPGETDRTIRGSSEIGLHLHIMVCDDATYPNSFWYHNGRNQGTPDGGSAGADPSAWSCAGGSDNDLDILRGGRMQLAGWFYHYDAFTWEECQHYHDLIRRFKGLPIVDPDGFGVVPDHVWDVKRQMVPGTNGLASWTSEGATGGVALTRQDASIRVVDFDDQFANVR